MGAGSDATARLDPVYDEDTDADDGSAEIGRRRAEIEQTRAEMGGTIGAIAEKLNPQTLMEQAKETAHEVAADVAQQAKDVVEHAKESVHDATVGRAQEAIGRVRGAVSDTVHTAQDAVGSAVHTAQDAGSTLMDTIKQNPIPVALVGIGLGWLIMNNMNGGDGRRRRNAYDYPGGYDYQPGYRDQSGVGAGVGQAARQVTERVGDAADSARERVGEVTDRARYAAAQARYRAGETVDDLRERAGNLADETRARTRQVQNQLMQGAEVASERFERTFEENPLAVGAVALGLGMVVGMLVPETQPEHRLMGETRDRLAQQAGQAAQGAMDRVQNVAQEAVTRAADVAREQGLGGQGSQRVQAGSQGQGSQQGQAGSQGQAQSSQPQGASAFGGSQLGGVQQGGSQLNRPGGTPPGLGNEEAKAQGLIAEEAA